MRRVAGSRMGVLALGVLALVGFFGFLGLRAGEVMDEAQPVEVAPLINNPPLNVREANVDPAGFIRVREQGTVAVTGTVNVASGPTVQDVRVTNTPIPVTGSVTVQTGTVRKFHQEFYPFDKEEDFEVDISEFSRVRLYVVVNGSDSTVDFVYTTDASVRDSFSVDTGDSRSILLSEVAGTKLRIFLDDPDGEQVFVSVFGTR